MNRLAVVVLLSFVLSLFGCGESAKPKQRPQTATNTATNQATVAAPTNETTFPKPDLAAVEKEIRDCFARYKEAIMNGRGKEAAEYVDQATIEWYRQSLEWAKSAKRHEVEAMPFMDKMQVLMIRSRIPKEKVLSMSGKEFFIYGVDSGMVSKDSVEKIGGVSKVSSIHENFAKTKMLHDGKEAPFGFSFTFEEGQWKLNIPSVFLIASQAIKTVVKEMEMTEDQFIFSSLEHATGKKPTDSLWEPLVP